VLEIATGDDPSNKRLSYPKFGINCNGTNLSISMKQGIWGGATYNNSRLKMINLPVLKRHNTAGSTIAVKNYLGFITTAGNNRWVSPSYLHCWLLSINDAEGTCPTDTREYGLIARQMANIRRADLDIVDAIWVNPRDNAGYHGYALRQDVLLAGRDPFALDYYSSEYLLGPLVEDELGSSAAQDSMASDPGVFRTFLMRNVSRLKSEGMNDTIDINDGMNQAQEEAQFNVYVADAGMEFENIYIDPCGCTNTPCKGSITDAVDEISGPTALYIAGITFTENISLNSGVMITMKGGFNSGCSTDGPYTTIIGNVPNTATLTIRDATLTVEDIILN
ncbi:MAG: DUF362 domain-containing protein, partial [bacterium]|nr:DUF362 domain-containing protein [bacterium]